MEKSSITSGPGLLYLRMYIDVSTGVAETTA